MPWNFKENLPLLVYFSVWRLKIVCNHLFLVYIFPYFHCLKLCCLGIKNFSFISFRFCISRSTFRRSFLYLLSAIIPSGFLNRPATGKSSGVAQILLYRCCFVSVFVHVCPVIARLHRCPQHKISNFIPYFARTQLLRSSS